MNSKDFKTKTFTQPRLNPTVPGKWPIALDIYGPYNRNKIRVITKYIKAPFKIPKWLF